MRIHMGCIYKNPWFYGVLSQTEQEQPTVKTAEEIISYLEMELAEAHEAHDLAEDKQERLFHLIKASTIVYLLEEIKEK